MTDITIDEAIEELEKVDTLDMPVRLCAAHYKSIEVLKSINTNPISNMDAIREMIRDALKFWYCQGYEDGYSSRDVGGDAE